MPLNTYRSDGPDSEGCHYPLCRCDALCFNAAKPGPVCRNVRQIHPRELARRDGMMILRWLGKALFVVAPAIIVFSNDDPVRYLLGALVLVAACALFTVSFLPKSITQSRRP